MKGDTEKSQGLRDHQSIPPKNGKSSPMKCERALPKQPRRKKKLPKKKAEDKIKESEAKSKAREEKKKIKADKKSSSSNKKEDDDPKAGVARDYGHVRRGQVIQYGKGRSFPPGKNT